MFNFAIRLIATLSVVVSLSSCGYQFQGSGSILPADVRKVYIPLVENNSTEPGLSQVMTEALRDSFERFGVITVVEDINQADAVLRARILSVSRDTSTTSSRTDTSLQDQLVLSLGGELRRITGPVLWRNAKLSVSKTYGTTSSVVVKSSADFASGSLGAEDLSNLGSREVSRGQEREALNNLAEELAKKLYDDAVAPDF